MLHAIQVQRQLISVESLNPTAVYKAVTKLFPAYVADVKAFVATVFDRTTPIFGIVDVKPIERKLNSANYVQMMPISIFVPPGMNTDYLAYIAQLEYCQEIIDVLEGDVLDPFATWLAVLLTNPDNLASVRQVNTGVRFHALDEAQKRIHGCFNKTGIAEVTYGAVVKRNGDLPTVVRRLNTLNDRLGRIDRKGLMAKVELITQHLDRLIQNIESDPELYRVSGVTLDTLSKLCYQVGAEIEFYSVHAFNLQSMTTAVKESVAKIERILNQ